MDENTRVAKVLIDGEWVDIKPIDIKKGMTFKISEADGTPIVYKNTDTFIASKDSFYGEDGVGITPIEEPV